jgi:hypothetical protein
MGEDKSNYANIYDSHFMMSHYTKSFKNVKRIHVAILEQLIQKS